MDGLNFAPDLLADETIVGMALRHGAELAHVQGFAQVHLHVPADLVGERHDVLRFARQIVINLLVQLRRAFHAVVELALEGARFDLRRRVVAVCRGEILALLGENPVAVEIAVQSEVTENIEGVIDVFESPAQLVAAVAPLGKIFLEYLLALRLAQRRGDLAQLLQRLARLAVEHRRDDFRFRIRIVIDQGHRLLGRHRRNRRPMSRQRFGRGGGGDKIVIALRALDEGRNQLIQFAVNRRAESSAPRSTRASKTC